MYVLFLLKAINELRLGGRATFIIPSEFLNSNYGVVIKEHLVQSGMLRHLFIVNSDSNVFEDATTTTTIIFLENSKSDEQVKFYNIDNIEQFNSDYQELVPFFQIPNNELQPRLKWRRYYEIENSQFYSNLIDFSEYARVRRGIATGANDYFLFNKTKAKEYGIPKECLVPTITKANQIKTNFFNNTDLEELIEQDKKVFLFDGLKASNEQSVQDYINEGVKQSVNERYLTKSKKPWFRLEERDVAPILVGVFNRGGLKFIRNESHAKNLTSFHCIYVHEKHIKDIELLFAYLLTDVAKEIFNDQSRDYGNGLKKFEPNDLNKSKVLDLSVLSDDERNKIMSHLNEYKISGDKNCIAQINDLFKQRFLIED